MQADTLDFRRGGANNVEFRPVTLPDSVVEDCRKVATLLDLKFAAIDIRKTPDEEYVFFEGNPSPVFQLYEHATGYPISDRLINLLMRHDNT